MVVGKQKYASLIYKVYPKNCEAPLTALEPLIPSGRLLMAFTTSEQRRPSSQRNMPTPRVHLSNETTKEHAEDMQQKLTVHRVASREHRAAVFQGPRALRAVCQDQ